MFLELLWAPRQPSLFGTISAGLIEGHENHLSSSQFITTGMGLAWIASCWQPDSYPYSHPPCVRFAESMAGIDSLLDDLAIRLTNLRCSASYSSSSKPAALSELLRILAPVAETAGHKDPTVQSRPN